MNLKMRQLLQRINREGQVHEEDLAPEDIGRAKELAKLGMAILMSGSWSGRRIYFSQEKETK